MHGLRRQLGRITPVAGLALLLTIASLPGCAADRGSRGVAPGESPLARLHDLAGRQADRPDPRAAEAPPPPGVGDSLSPPTDLDPKTVHASLDVALAALAPPSEPPERHEMWTDAVRLYVKGRAAMVNGDMTTAIAELDAATQRDPVSPEPFEALGEAQMSMGSRFAALDSFRKAFKNGSTAAGPLLMLALDAHEGQSDRQAVVYLARILRLNPAGLDPAVMPVAHVTLGEALRSLGYLAAANESALEGLDLPEAWSVPTRFRPELTALYRSRADLWRQVGDTACRLDDFKTASTAYAKSAALPSMNPAALVPRRVYVLMRLGRPAAAALAVIDDFRDQPARLDERYIGILRHIRRHNSTLGRTLAGALATCCAKVKADAAPTLRSRFIRAHAAAMPDADARRLLLAHLRQWPGDESALDDLIAVSDPRRPESLVKDLGQILQQHGGPAEAYAGALLDGCGDRASLLNAARRAGSATGVRLLRARLLLGAGRPHDAAGVAEDLAQSAPTEPAVALAEAQINAALGDWEHVDAAIGRLLAATAPDVRLFAAEAIETAQRFDRAYQTIRPEIDRVSDPTNAGVLLVAARLAVLAGHPQDAQTALKRAISLDPYLDAAYVGLINLYRDGGPLADDRKMNEAVVGLRTISPSSRSLRMLRAHELLRAGRTAEARHDVADILDEDPTDGAARELMLSIWEASVSDDPKGSTQQAIEWIDSARHVDETWRILARARIYVAAKDPGQAEAVLKRAGKGVNQASLDEQRERILRAAGRAAEADRMALKRLEAAPPTIDNTISLAAVLAHQGRPGDAAARLRGNLPSGAMLTPEQSLSLLEGVQALGDGQTDQADRLALIGRAVDLMPSAPIGLHRMRLSLAIQTGSAEQAAAAVRCVVSRGLLDKLAATMGSQNTDDSTVMTAADLAYEVAVSLANAGFESQAETLYRLALKYDPKHPGSNNNLGYSLIERGESIDEAAKMIETAYRAKPDDASFIDSLGWLRYRMGVFNDKEGPNGETIEEGAVTLLGVAVKQPEGQTNPTVHDHYGDALWRAGNHQDAVQQWTQAQSLADRMLQIQAAAGSKSSRLTGMLTEVRDRARAKAQAAQLGKKPLLAPLFKERPTPAGAGQGTP